MLCEYGCGQEAVFVVRKTHNCCSDVIPKCPSIRAKNKASLEGRIKSKETCERIAAGRKGKGTGRKKEISEYKSASCLRVAYIEKYGNKCQKCGWSETNPFYDLIPTQLHHKDGDDKNSEEDNLELLCPNCHSLTEYFMFYGRKHKTGC